MDVSTREQWVVIVAETIAAQPRMAAQLLAMVRGLGGITDVWDQKAFDPNYRSETLEHFEPLVTRVFARAKSI
jgi:hypothetical protein